MCSTTVTNPDFRILNVLSGLAAHHGKMWCFPSQEKILDLLNHHQHRTMCRRSLNSHLAALEQRGYIERKRRHKKGKNGSLELHSTLYVLKAACVQMLTKGVQFFRVASAHPWAKRWITAVQEPAQCMDLHINIIDELPKKRADSS